MRSAREEDFPQLLDLWRAEFAGGRQDIVPSEPRLRRMLGRFDWDSKSRVVERDGRIAGLGLQLVRPWWRMDRGIGGGLPRAKPVRGDEVIDGRAARPGLWADLFNGTFADHWRFTPRGEQEIVADKVPELCLMAVTADRREPVALTFVELET